MHPDWLYYEQSKQVSVAARENFDEWAQWLAAHDSRYHFGKTRAEVTAYMDKIRAKLAARPVAWPSEPEAPKVNGSWFDVIVGYSGYRPEWDLRAELVGKIRDAANSSAERPALSSDASKALAVLYGSIKPTYSGVFNAVTCEADWPADPKVYERQMRLFRVKYPYGFGALQAGQSPCTYRSFTPPEKLVELRRDGYPAGVVVQAEFDRATQYDGGPAMAAKLDDSLISVSDEGGHGMYGRNPCVTEKIDDYLIRGILPGARTVCAGSPPARPAGRQQGQDVITVARAAGEERRSHGEARPRIRTTSRSDAATRRRVWFMTPGPTVHTVGMALEIQWQPSHRSRPPLRAPSWYPLDSRHGDWRNLAGHGRHPERAPASQGACRM